MSPSLVLRQVVKSYPGVMALKGVDFEVEAGEIHGLVGENGAGKSTLMGVACGAVAATSGRVEICGAEPQRPDPALTAQLGLALVHQHPALLPDLTVRDNVLLGLPPDRRPHRRDVDAWIRELTGDWGQPIDPSVRASRLDMRDQFVVEISRALACRPRVLLLDEPTEHLDGAGVDLLFQHLRSLRDQGTALVYISHRIPEVLEITDRVTVLRDGQTRGTYRSDATSESRLVELVVGRELDAVFPDKTTPDANTPVVLDLAGFSSGRVSGLDLQVRAGEIVGIAGIEGNGQQDLVRALVGLAPARGTVRVADREVELSSSTHARRAGIVFLPGDRHSEGVHLDLSVERNIALSALSQFSRAGIIDRGRQHAAVGTMSQRLRVRTPSLATPVRNLSGGNQQKVVLARAALADPAVIVADQPTQGVDAGARVEIYEILRDVTEAGRAVVVNSADALELAGLCDRVIVLSRGQVVTELTGDRLTEQAITTAALTATTVGGQRGDTPPRGLARWRSLLDRDTAPTALLLATMLGLAAITANANDSYLTARNLQGYLTLLTPLLLVSLGQQLVLLLGLIDLSVGPLTGFLVVIASFFVVDTAGGGGTLLGLTLMVAAAVGVGLLHWGLVEWVRMNAVVATLLTFTALQGLSLWLRPVPAGALSGGVTDAIETTLGPVPIALVAAVCLGLLLEWGSRRTMLGIAMRATGSDAAVAEVLGVRTRRSILLALVGCSLLTLLAGVMLMAQVGIGTPTAGIGYTLTSIGAVVLGGASVFGGRGSFVGAMAGAALIQQIVNATVFLRLDSAWQSAFIGGLLLVATALFSSGRRPATAT